MQNKEIYRNCNKLTTGFDKNSSLGIKRKKEKNATT